MAIYVFIILAVCFNAISGLHILRCEPGMTGPLGCDSFVRNGGQLGNSGNFESLGRSQGFQDVGMVQNTMPVFETIGNQNFRQGSVRPFQQGFVDASEFSLINDPMWGSGGSDVVRMFPEQSFQGRGSDVVRMFPEQSFQGRGSDVVRMFPEQSFQGQGFVGQMPMNQWSTKSFGRRRSYYPKKIRQRSRGYAKNSFGMSSKFNPRLPKGGQYYPKGMKMRVFSVDAMPYKQRSMLLNRGKPFRRSSKRSGGY